MPSYFLKISLNSEFCSIIAKLTQKRKKDLKNHRKVDNFQSPLLVAPERVELSMGESKSPALPLGDGALS